MTTLNNPSAFRRTDEARVVFPRLSFTEPARAAGRIVLLYVVVAALWILLSDRVMFALVTEPATLATLGIFKGWFFVAVTAGLLFALLRARFEVNREHEEKLRLFIDHAPVALAMLDRELRYLTVSRRWSADHCLGEQVLRGRRHYDVMPGIPESWREAHRRALAGESLREESGRFVRADGAVRWLRWEVRPWHDAKDAIGGIVMFCEDITERKTAEEALQASQVRLRESENRFREVVETIREVFWISDAEKSRILYVSPAYEKIWQRPCAELYASAREWLQSVHPEDRARVAQASLTGQAAGTYDETFRVVRPDLSVRWVRDRAYPVRDESGEVVRIVGTSEDVTERKKLEEQFLRTQRLEAIGTLASGVAHDLNNILSPIFMIAPLLTPKLSDPADVEMLGIVERSAVRGANVVRQLLTFSRGIAGERGPLQIRHLVAEMAAIMSETFPREIGISQMIPADLTPVVGDATQLHQVLMNLCVNARDAMPDGGRLSIEAANIFLGPEDVRGQAGANPGRHVVLTVSDTGHGIPPELRARLFEPFFTTKDVGKGTGLGLSTVLGIVKSHGGFVTVESEVARGTAFRVYLPCSDSDHAASAPVAPRETPSRQGELVLVVDDEPSVRTAMQHVLENKGFAVLTAASGREGLALFLLQRAHVRAVVTDLMMADMGGVALVRALRDLSPNLAILAASGLEGAESRDSLYALGVTELLPKPYAPAELLEALDRELAKCLPVAV